MTPVREYSHTRTFFPIKKREGIKLFLALEKFRTSRSSRLLQKRKLCVSSVNVPFPYLWMLPQIQLRYILSAAVKLPEAIEAYAALENTQAIKEFCTHKMCKGAAGIVRVANEFRGKAIKGLRIRGTRASSIACKGIFFPDFAHNEVGQPVNILCAQFSSPPFLNTFSNTSSFPGCVSEESIFHGTHELLFF